MKNQHELSRRDFLKQGLLFTASGLLVQGSLSDSVSADTLNDSRPFRVIRGDDLLNLEFNFIKFRLANGKLKPIGSHESLVVVTFPPQNLAEIIFDELHSNPPASVPGQAAPRTFELDPIGVREGKRYKKDILNAHPPVTTMMSGPSWLAFQIPDNPPDGSVDEWDLDPDDWIRRLEALMLKVPLGATEELWTPQEPHRDQTRLEIPFRLFISPGPATRMQASQFARKKTSASTCELWHAALFSRKPVIPSKPPEGLEKAPEELRPPRKVVLDAKAVYSPDWQSKGQPPFNRFFPRTTDLSLHALTRHRLVKQMSEGDGKIDVENLILSALGANASFYYASQKPVQQIIQEQLNSQIDPGTELRLWKHRMTIGRDVFFAEAFFGFLLPFDFPAVYVEITQRKFAARIPPDDQIDQSIDLSAGSDDDFLPGAYLMKVRYILVIDPTKHAPSATSPMGRKAPHSKRATLRMMRSPNLAKPMDLTQQFPPAGKNFSEFGIFFRPCIAEQPGRNVDWEIDFEDGSGNVKTGTTNLYFSSHIGLGHYIYEHPPMDGIDDAFRQIRFPAAKLSYTDEAPAVSLDLDSIVERLLPLSRKADLSAAAGLLGPKIKELLANPPRAVDDALAALMTSLGTIAAAGIVYDILTAIRVKSATADVPLFLRRCADLNVQLANPELLVEESKNAAHVKQGTVRLSVPVGVPIAITARVPDDFQRVAGRLAIALNNTRLSGAVHDPKFDLAERFAKLNQNLGGMLKTALDVIQDLPRDLFDAPLSELSSRLSDLYNAANTGAAVIDEVFVDFGRELGRAGAMDTITILRDFNVRLGARPTEQIMVTLKSAGERDAVAQAIAEVHTEILALAEHNALAVINAYRVRILDKLKGVSASERNDWENGLLHVDGPLLIALRNELNRFDIACMLAETKLNDLGTHATSGVIKLLDNFGDPLALLTPLKELEQRAMAVIGQAISDARVGLRASTDLQKLVDNTIANAQNKLPRIVDVRELKTSFEAAIRNDIAQFIVELKGEAVKNLGELRTALAEKVDAWEKLRGKVSGRSGAIRTAVLKKAKRVLDGLQAGQDLIAKIEDAFRSQQVAEEFEEAGRQFLQGDIERMSGQLYQIANAAQGDVVRLGRLLQDAGTALKNADGVANSVVTLVSAELSRAVKTAVDWQIPTDLRKAAGIVGGGIQAVLDEVNAGSIDELLPKFKTALKTYTQSKIEEVERETPELVERAYDESTKLLDQIRNSAQNDISRFKGLVEDFSHQLKVAEKVGSTLETHAVTYTRRFLEHERDVAKRVLGKLINSPNSPVTDVEKFIAEGVADAGKAFSKYDSELRHLKDEISAMISSAGATQENVSGRVQQYFREHTAGIQEAAQLGSRFFNAQLEKAEVVLPAVKELVKGIPAREIKMVEDYVTGGFKQAQNGAFAKLTQALDEGHKIGAAVQNGVAQTEAAIAGISREIGGIVGRGKETVERLARTGKDKIDDLRKDIQEAIPNAKLFGTIPIKDLIGAISRGRLPKIASLELPEKIERTWDFTTKLESRSFFSVLSLDVVDPNCLIRVLNVTTLTLPKPQELARNPQLRPGFSSTLDGYIGAWDEQRKQELEPANGKYSFALNLLSLVEARFKNIRFGIKGGADGISKPTFKPSIDKIVFLGPLEFLNDLQKFLDGLGVKGFKLEITPEYVSAGFGFNLPAIAFGAFSMRGMTLGAALKLPFGGDPLRFGFYISTFQNPFELTVMCFGGRGFLAVEFDTRGKRFLEGALEFGGALSFDVGVASGGLYVMAGFYFKIANDSTELSGYLRAGGNLNVLNLIHANVEFKLAMIYRSGAEGNELYGTCEITVSISLFMFSIDVSISMEKHIAGSSTGGGGSTAFLERDDSDIYLAGDDPARPRLKNGAATDATLPAKAREKSSRIHAYVDTPDRSGRFLSFRNKQAASPAQAVSAAGSNSVWYDNYWRYFEFDEGFDPLAQGN